LPAAALADLFISALNNNGGAFHQSPAMTACEEEAVRLFLDLFSFPAGSDGMFLAGGTFANLQALVLARSRAVLGGEVRRPRVYTSETAHFSVARAAYVAGIPEAGIVAIPTRGRGEMIPEALAEQIRLDRREGAIPVAAVATAGTRELAPSTLWPRSPPSVRRSRCGFTSMPVTAGRRSCPRRFARAWPGSKGPIRSRSIRTSGFSFP
jgi:glutamate/tyrosine decarboxylase-like PLP-dependent enzyme